MRSSLFIPTGRSSMRCCRCRRRVVVPTRRILFLPSSFSTATITTTSRDVELVIREAQPQQYTSRRYLSRAVARSASVLAWNGDGIFIEQHQQPEAIRLVKHRCYYYSTSSTTAGPSSWWRRNFSSSSSSSSSRSVEGKGTGDVHDQEVDVDYKEDEDELIYESPLGNLVTRLRAVSLATAIIGSVGLPMVVAIKGGPLPSTGFLALGLVFCTGSLGTTAIIHYVFHPYVYTIHRIHSNEAGTDTTNSSSPPTSTAASTTTIMNNKDTTHYKVTSRSLFLRPIETVFDLSSFSGGNDDTTADAVGPYKGIRPMCNFTVNGLPLYVHSEYLFNPELRQAMQLDTRSSSTNQNKNIADGDEKEQQKKNLDDDLF